MAKQPKRTRVVAHKDRMKRKEAMRSGQPQDVAPKTGLRHLRQRIAKNPRIFYVATAVVLGGLAVTLGFKNKAVSPYCFLPAATTPTDTHIMGMITLGDATDIDYRIVAQQLQDVLNEKLADAQLLDTSLVKDTRISKVVGAVIGQDVVLQAGQNINAADLPNQGSLRLNILGKDYVVPTNSTFVVKPNMREISIGGYRFDTTDIILNGNPFGALEPGRRAVYTLPSSIIYKTRSTPECN